MKNITWGQLYGTVAMISAWLTSLVEGLDLTVWVVIFMGLFLFWRIQDIAEQVLYINHEDL